MPQITNNFSNVQNLNYRNTEPKKRTIQQNKKTLSTTQKILIGTSALAAITVGGLLFSRHKSNKQINSLKNAVNSSNSTVNHNKKLMHNKNRAVLNTTENAQKKIEEVIANPPKLQGGKPIKKGQQDIIFNNIDTTSMVRGETNLNGVVEDMITPQEHSVYSRSIKYKSPGYKQRKIIDEINSNNAQQTAELNSLANSKYGDVLRKLLSQLN